MNPGAEAICDGWLDRFCGAPGRLLAASVAPEAKEDHGFHG